jgi:hypothetical protein
LLCAIIYDRIYKYNYALHLLQIGHLFPRSFSEQLEQYIHELQTINVFKDVILHWAISRGQYHEGGVNDFFKVHLPKVRSLLPKIESLAQYEFIKIQPTTERAC